MDTALIFKGPTAVDLGRVADMLTNAGFAVVTEAADIVDPRAPATLLFIERALSRYYTSVRIPDIRKLSRAV